MQQIPSTRRSPRTQNGGRGPSKGHLEFLIKQTELLSLSALVFAETKRPN